MTQHYWFISTKRHQHTKLILFTFLLAFVVILMGAYTRLTNAGLSCPDWPHCYGFITAPHTDMQLQQAASKYPLTPVDIKKAWTEMAHRYAAGTEGILILLLVGSILFTKKAKETKSIWMGLALTFFLGVQVTLGMLTVTAQLKPVIVLSHLVIGLSILSLLWWMYLDRYLSPESISGRSGKSLMPWALIACFIIGVQIILGGWVSTHYAGLACVDFPYCNGMLLPKLAFNQIQTDLITIHMLHRLGAAVTGIYFSLFALALMFNSRLRSMGWLIFGLIALQLTLGILNILWLRPVGIALAHQGVAILLLLTTLTVLAKIRLESRANFYDFS